MSADGHLVLLVVLIEDRAVTADWIHRNFTLAVEIPPVDAKAVLLLLKLLPVVVVLVGELSIFLLFTFTWATCPLAVQSPLCCSVSQLRIFLDNLTICNLLDESAKILSHVVFLVENWLRLLLYG